MKKQTKKLTKKLPYVIARCHDAGVHAGYLVSRHGREVRLKDSRRLWRWWSQFSLSELATLGPRQDKLDENKYACVVPDIELLDCAEVIYCTPEAEVAIKAIKNANT